MMVATVMFWAVAVAAPIRLGVDARSVEPMPASGLYDSDRGRAAEGAPPVRAPVVLNLCRSAVETVPDQWDFTIPDSIVASVSEPVVGIVCWDAQADAQADAEANERSPTEVGQRGTAYIQRVVQHYAQRIQHWEVDGSPHGATATVREQGKRSGQIARIIRQHDPDARVVLRAVSGWAQVGSPSQWASFMEGAGAGAFDVVSYRALDPAVSASVDRPELRSILAAAGWSDLGFWRRIEVPKDDALEHPLAVGALKQTVEAWVAGDEAVFWPAELFPDLDRSGPNQKVFSLVRSHLHGFIDVSRMKGLGPGQHGYRFELTDGSQRWLVWGRGTIAAPSRPYAKAMTPVLAHPDDRHQWKGVPDALPLGPVPMLIRN